jgi:transcriptional regulator with XRE-family HTH domain
MTRQNQFPPPLAPQPDTPGAPNRQLAWERLQRGWSYEEVAARIRRAMGLPDEADEGLTAEAVWRWETGDWWPDPHYRKHLVAVFQRPASDLGLLLPAELEMRPETAANVEAGTILAVVHDDRVGEVDRATVLRDFSVLARFPSWRFYLVPTLNLSDV